MYFHNIYGCDCHAVFEKSYKTALERDNGMNGDDAVTKSSENYVSLKMFEIFRSF